MSTVLPDGVGPAISARISATREQISTFLNKYLGLRRGRLLLQEVSGQDCLQQIARTLVHSNAAPLLADHLLVGMRSPLEPVQTEIN